MDTETLKPETPDDGISVFKLIKRHARDASHATLFNYASMAYNHHRFFRSLVKPAPPPVL